MDPQPRTQSTKKSINYLLLWITPCTVYSSDMYVYYNIPLSDYLGGLGGMLSMFGFGGNVGIGSFFTGTGIICRV